MATGISRLAEYASDASPYASFVQVLKELTRL
jgi:hypothetical protein